PETQGGKAQLEHSPDQCRTHENPSILVKQFDQLTVERIRIVNPFGIAIDHNGQRGIGSDVKPCFPDLVMEIPGKQMFLVEGSAKRLHTEELHRQPHPQTPEMACELG